MKFFKSRFFLILCIVTFLIAATFTAMSALGYSSYIKGALNYVAMPFQKLADTVGRALDGYAAYITEFDRLKAENAELREKLDAMEEDVREAEAVKSENEYLREYLEIKNEHLDFAFAKADVIGRESGNYMTVFTLDRGTDAGISKGMPIIASNGGLIGHISDAGKTWAKAASVIDVTSSVGAYVERSLENGVITGDFELCLKGLCKMTYLDADADIAVGDRIMTSGLGSVYPRGLVIGTVKELVKDDAARSITAIIEPLADISALDTVMVVTKFETYSE